MALDLYAGSLTRYLSGDWSTENEVWAARNGVEYRRLTLDGPITPRKPGGLRKWFLRRKLRAPVNRWKVTAERLIGTSIDLDDQPNSPHLTRQSQWIVLSAARLWASYLAQNLSPPWPLAEEFDDDPVWAKERESAGSISSPIVAAEMWLPVEIHRAVRIPWVDGSHEVSTHSAAALQETLSLVLRAFPPRTERDEDQTNFFDGVAKIREVVSFSIRKRVPMLLDY